VEAINNSKMD